MPDLYLKVWDRKYPFSFNDLTVGRMRKIKEWFGPELGRYNSFITTLHLLDPDAALAAVWVARDAAGERNVPEPNQMGDFPLRGFLEDPPGIGVEAGERDNPPTEGESPTPDSTETLTGSAENTSDD